MSKNTPAKPMKMVRLSTEIHKKLRVMAALRDYTISEYIEYLFNTSVPDEVRKQLA